MTACEEGRSHLQPSEPRIMLNGWLCVLAGMVQTSRAVAHFPFWQGEGVWGKITGEHFCYVRVCVMSGRKGKGLDSCDVSQFEAASVAALPQH